MFDTDKSLCFRADIDVAKPLQCGVNVMMGEKHIWIRTVGLPNCAIFAMAAGD